MRIVFSKDRPAQLDLLLRSIDRHMIPEETVVLIDATDFAYDEGYGLLVERYVPNGSEHEFWLGDFDMNLRWTLSHAGETTTFFCDDDVVINPVSDLSDFKNQPEVFTISLRLGKDNGCMPWQGTLWEWAALERHTFGFPASIDGHMFHTADIIEMIGREPVRNPTMLETTMSMRAEAFAQARPLMGCFEQQKLVGVPVNRVSDNSTCITGRFHPQPTKDLNDRFLGGERIDLDALDFTGCDDVHWEVTYEWRKA